MLSQAILEKLLAFSDEEIDALNGKVNIDRSIYFDDEETIDARKILDEGALIGVRKHTRFMSYPAHKHNYIELMYVYSGTMTTTIDDHNIHLKTGQLLLVNQAIEHSIAPSGENDIIFNFIIKQEMLSFLSSVMGSEYKLNDFIFHSLYSSENIGDYLIFDLEKNDLVTSYVEAIITHLYEPTLNNKIELKLLMGLLMSELMNHPEAIQSYTKSTYDKVLMSTIYKYITLNYNNASLSELGEMVHMKDYQLSKFIKKMTGTTFIQLLKDMRFKKATELMEYSSYSIERIINEVGYENESYFYKTFKKQYHMTPMAYKKKQEGKHESL